jgi:hypothetical protein
MASPSNDFLSKDFIFLVQDGGNNNVFAHEHLKKKKRDFGHVIRFASILIRFQSKSEEGVEMRERKRQDEVGMAHLAFHIRD